MNNMTFTIPNNVFRALLPLTAKHSIRAWLRGYRLECNAGKVILCAADGHAVGIFRVDAPESSEPLEDFSYLIPHDAIEQVKKGSGATTIKFFETHTPMGDAISVSRKAEIINDNAFIPFAVETAPSLRIGQLFTNISKLGEKIAHLDNVLLYKFTKVAAILGGVTPDKCGCHVVVAQRGKWPSFVTLRGIDNFVGILMPFWLVDDHAPLATKPDWL